MIPSPETAIARGRVDVSLRGLGTVAVRVVFLSARGIEPSRHHPGGAIVVGSRHDTRHGTATIDLFRATEPAP